MAFTDAQKRDIRKYMGVPFGFYELSHRLESMMGLVGGSATDAAQIVIWLDRLAEIDDALTGEAAASASASYGALKKVDEVEFYDVTDETEAGTGTLTLVQQGRTLIGRIARAMGVSDYLPIGDYFGSQRSMGSSISLG
ncbi:hypothetical protein [Caudoviricetes sp.]|nr:hypothetical protein [Caudoviricetes sp.]